MNNDCAIILEPNTTLFKGISKTFDNTSERHCWFALDQSIADNYAQLYAQSNVESKVILCTTTKPLKLLNIMSIKFKYDFWDKVNMIYADNNCMDERKIKVLLALGLPSFDIQKTCLQIDMSKCNSVIDTWAQALGGHRQSQIDSDNLLVNTINLVYPNMYDGYIQKYNVPTCMQQSLFFPREVCLFGLKDKVTNMQVIVTYKKSKGGKLKVKKGGAIDPTFCYFLERDNLTQKDFDDVRRDIVVSCVYLIRVQHVTGLGIHTMSFLHTLPM